MLSIHERVSKQDESEREIKEEIIHRADAEGALVQRVQRFLLFGKFSCLCVEIFYSLTSNRWNTAVTTGVVTG